MGKYSFMTAVIKSSVNHKFRIRPSIYSTVQYIIVRYSTVQYSAVLYSTLQYGRILNLWSTLLLITAVINEYLWSTLLLITAVINEYLYIPGRSSKNFALKDTPHSSRHSSQ